MDKNKQIKRAITSEKQKLESPTKTIHSITLEDKLKLCNFFMLLAQINQRINKKKEKTQEKSCFNELEIYY